MRGPQRTLTATLLVAATTAPLTHGCQPVAVGHITPSVASCP